MSSETFISLAPRCEDLILYRALGGRPGVRFLELTATPGGAGRLKALESLGWIGATIPVLSIHNDEHAATLPGAPLDVILVDDDDVSGRIVTTLDLLAQRPGIAVMRAPSEAGGALEPEGASGAALLLSAGYTRTLFDGVSHYLVAPEYIASVLSPLGDPSGNTGSAGHHDDIEVTRLNQQLNELTIATARLAEANEALVADVHSWRARAIERWSEAAIEHAGRGRSNEALAEELFALRQTLSWRITRPLRMLRTISNRSARKARANDAAR